jgi:ATP-dependent exoDNAse (exonuclease V) alpha subunit
MPVNYRDEKKTPVTPVERFTELMGQKGIGEVTAWRMVCDEPQWWNDDRIALRNACAEARIPLGVGKEESFTKRQILLVVSWLTEKRASETNVTRYRNTEGGFLKCLINPWTIIQDIPRYGLDDADALAKVLNIPLTSPDRIAEVAMHSLGKAMKWNGGDSYVMITEVQKEFRKLTANISSSIGTFAEAIEELETTGRVRTFDIIMEVPGMGLRPRSCITRRNLWTAEKIISDRITNLHAGSDFGILDEDAHPDLVMNQQIAWREAFRKPVVIVDAPPGYGKTFTIASIVKTCAENEIPVIVGTFMGRAATRVKNELSKPKLRIQVSGEDSDLLAGPGTLHSILRINTENDKAEGLDYLRKKKGKERFLDEDGDFKPGIFIIDEASMVSSNIMGTVMESVPGDWNIVLMGDSRQLPPISEGRPFNDIIESGKAEWITLNECQRTDQRDLMDGIASIREYVTPESSENFRIHKVEREGALNEIMQVVQQTAKDLECRPEKLLIVTAHSKPTKRRVSGLVTVSDLNKLLKRDLNPKEYRPREWWIPQPGDRVYAKGPKTGGSPNAAHKRGDHQRAFNGEIGTLTEISPPNKDSEGYALVLWDDHEDLETYTLMEAQGENRILDLGYAVTVHKVQGAEAPGIIFVADGNGYENLLTNSLAYTACSRGQKRTVVATLLSDQISEGFDMAVKRHDSKRRTMLSHFLNGDLPNNLKPSVALNATAAIRPTKFRINTST